MKYILDTNIIVYFINGTYPSIPRCLSHIPSNDILIPTIVLGELEYGARNSSNYDRNKLKFDQFVSAFKIAPFNKAAAVSYGSIRYSLKAQGTPIGSNDLLIAAIALANNATLVTHNVKEFERVEGLSVQDWTEF